MTVRVYHRGWLAVALSMAVFIAFAFTNNWTGWRVPDGQTANLLYAASMSGAVIMGLALQRAFRLFGRPAPILGGYGPPGWRSYGRLLLLAVVLVMVGVFAANVEIDCDARALDVEGSVTDSRQADEFTAECEAANWYIYAAGSATVVSGLLLVLFSWRLVRRLERE